jgi:hypothetical protein
MTSFIDSGSSALFFPSPLNGSLPDCSRSHGISWSGDFCPSSVQTFTAVNSGSTSATSGSVTFAVGNDYNLINSGNMVFNDYAANSTSDSSSTGFFDWGLPFFFGRNIYVGIESVAIGSLTATGPLWAY